jgi:hypothetical protein
MSVIDAPSRSRSLASACLSLWAGIRSMPARRQALPDNRSHPARLKRPNRRMHREEHAPAPALTARCFKTLDDGLADVAGQRELVALVGLAVDDDLPGAPIEIVEPQSRDLDGAQPQPCEQEQDRVVARAGRVLAVTRGEDPVDLRSRRELRDRRHAPARDPGNRTRESGIGEASDREIAQQRPQPAGRQQRHHPHPPPTQSPRRKAQVAAAPAAERSAHGISRERGHPDGCRRPPSSTLAGKTAACEISSRQKAPHTFAPTGAFGVVCSGMRLLKAANDAEVAPVSLSAA